MIYLSLFAVSFLAATILPFSSELTLAGLIATSDYDNLLLLTVASFGNILGSRGSVVPKFINLLKNKKKPRVLAGALKKTSG